MVNLYLALLCLDLNLHKAKQVFFLAQYTAFTLRRRRKVPTYFERILEKKIHSKVSMYNMLLNKHIYIHRSMYIHNKQIIIN